MNSWNDPRAGEVSRLQLALATFALQLDAFELQTNEVLRSIGHPRTTSTAVSLGREAKLPVNKVTWQKVDHVTEPGRYMFRFGWLTIVPDDLAIWKQFPDACFTLVRTSAPPLAPESDEVVAQTGEFHLGAFELHAASESASPDIRPADAIAAPAQSSP